MKFLKFAFIYKKHDTSQKARQFAIRFYIQKPGTLRYAIFHGIFEICGGGGGIYSIKKTMHYAGHFYNEKQCTLRYVTKYKYPDTMRYILISKKQCTFRYVYMHIIYRAVLIVNPRINNQ